MKRKHAHLEHERRDVLSQIKMAEDNGIIHPSGVIGSTTSAIVACEKRIFNINKELEIQRIAPRVCRLPRSSIVKSDIPMQKWASLL